jgi:hypothetical protein
MRISTPARLRIPPTLSRTLPAVLLPVLFLVGPVSGALIAAEKPAAGDWPEITEEERGLTNIPGDPDAEAVVLLEERHGKILKIADDYKNVMRYHWRAKILKPSGKRHAEVRIGAQKFSRVGRLEARTVKPDGSVIPVPADQIFDKLVRQIGSFKWTEKVFTFPAAEPGSILEYRYERNDDSLVYIDPWYFEGPLPTLVSRVTQAVLDEMGYMVLCDLCLGTKPQVTDWREGKTKGQVYSVEMRNLPGYRREGMMPPPREVSPHLEMVLQFWKDVPWRPLGRQDRLFTDWDSVAKYSLFRYEEAIKEGHAQLKPVVEEWIAGKTDPVEKVRTILRHVQEDFIYIPYRSVYGWSSSVEQLLKYKRADNEEKAVLVLASLRAAGLDGTLALVSGKDGGTINPHLFSPSQFTHTVVLWTRPDGFQQVLDPTVSYAPFGFVSWMDSGADALVLKPGSARIQQLPVKNELSATKYHVRLTPRDDGKAELEIEARFTGEDAIGLREDLAPAAESARKSRLESWLDDRRDGAALLSHSIENLTNPDEPLVLKLKAEASGLVTLAEGTMVVQGCVLECIGSNPISRGERRHPFYVERGWNDEQVVTIVPPSGMKAAEMPLPMAARSPIASHTMSCAPGDGEEVVCTRLFTARRNRWAAEERDRLRAMFDKVLEADRMAVPLAASPGSTASAGN